MKSLVAPTSLLFLVLWLFLLIGGRSRFFQDPGTFWHTVVGEQILNSRGFFDTDTFTFTFADKPWIPHQWLGEVALALLHRWGGFDSLLLGTVTLLAGLFAWLGGRLVRAGFHPSVTVVLVALGVAASSGHFHVRPHLMTIAGMAATMILLIDFDRRRIGLKTMAWLIPLYWVWANTHGGVLGGIVTLAVALLGWIAAKLLGKESPIDSWSQAGWLILIGLGCILVPLLNPYGMRLPQTWFDIYQSGELPKLIKEHARLDLTDVTNIPIAIFGGVYVLLLVGIGKQMPRVTWLIPLIWFALAWMRVRHAPLFAVAALAAIADFFPQTIYAASLQRKKSDLFMPPPKPLGPPSPSRFLAWVLPVIAVGTAFGLQMKRVEVPVIGTGWAQHNAEIWPVELLPLIKEHQFDDPKGTRIFNEFIYGGFLIYHAPGYRVFVDDRCELFGDAFLSEFVRMPKGVQQTLQDWETRYGTWKLALITRDSDFDTYFRNSPQWENLQPNSTATSILYRRKE